MLSVEDNRTLTRVGPGTPMGNFMRQYWVPAVASKELPAPGCAPVRVMLLGEKLIAFRSRNGKPGLVANACPHRGASLFFGRVEEDGIRCVYHGWKYGMDGQCLDMPSEPAGSGLKDKICARAYPCEERGGIVWAYMGPRDTPPPLPDLEANTLPEAEWNVPDSQSQGLAGLQVIQRECNWLQALENELDTAHQVFLHFGMTPAEEAEPGTMRRFALEERAARYKVSDMDYGMTYGAYRSAGAGKLYWRIAHYLFPFYVMVPIDVLGRYITARAWVPMDDNHVLLFSMHDSMPYLVNERKTQGGARLKVLPNTPDWFGRFRLAANQHNDYFIDRGKGNYTGIDGLTVEDQMVTESMGPIVDRSQEHLGSSDAGIIRMRRRLLSAVKAFEAGDAAAPGADNPELYRQRSGGVVLDEDQDWIRGTEHLRAAYVTHENLDTSSRGGLI